MEHIYYESDEYENEAQPGEFAAITITRDDDGPHFKFTCGEQVILDLPIPACEALAISYALQRSGRHTINAAERLVDDGPGAHQHTDHAGPPLPEPGMTPYGPREVGPGEAGPHEVRSGPESVGLPSGRRHELPTYTGSWMAGPEAVRVGPPPEAARRSA